MKQRWWHHGGVMKQRWWRHEAMSIAVEALAAPFDIGANPTIADMAANVGSRTRASAQSCCLLPLRTLEPCGYFRSRPCLVPSLSPPSDRQHRRRPLPLPLLPVQHQQQAQELRSSAPHLPWDILVYRSNKSIDLSNLKCCKRHDCQPCTCVDIKI